MVRPQIPSQEIYKAVAVPDFSVPDFWSPLFRETPARENRSVPSKQVKVEVDHPLAGTWITEEEDSNAAFTISIDEQEFRVSGFCRSDGEMFDISQVEWEDNALSFVARMPSTNHTTRNVFRLRPDGKADLELTLYEVWKKKDVWPGRKPEAWRASSGRPSPQSKVRRARSSPAKSLRQPTK